MSALLFPSNGSALWGVPLPYSLNNCVCVCGTADDEEEEVQAMFVYKLDPDDGDTVWSTTTDLGFLVSFSISV